MIILPSDGPMFILIEWEHFGEAVKFSASSTNENRTKFGLIEETMALSKVFLIRVGKIYEHPSVFLFPLTNLDF